VPPTPCGQEGKMRTWTIARRIVTTFATCAAIMTVLVFVCFVGFSKLRESHHATVVRAERALDVTEAASDGAELYNIIADGEVNGDLKKTQATWDASKMRITSRLARLASMAETADDGKLV